MTLSLVFMGSSANRAGVDVALPRCLGDTTVNGDGNPGVGTTFYPRGKGSIKGAFVNSETAGMLECMFHKATDANWNYLNWTHLQTEQCWGNMITRLNYPVDVGDAIAARGTNAGAVMDLLALYIDKGGGGEVPTQEVPSLPLGAILAHATATFTHVADSVAEGTIVWDDFTPVRDQKYKIIGLSADSATGLASRLHFTEGPNKEDYPGIPCTDSEAGGSQLNTMWYGDFGIFKGQTPPLYQAVAVGADASACITFLLLPVK